MSDRDRQYPGSYRDVDRLLGTTLVVGLIAGATLALLGSIVLGIVTH